MLGIPLRYLLKNPTAAASLIAHPHATYTNLVDEYVAKREGQRAQWPYQADGDWERKLHEYLGAPWPCSVSAEIPALWQQVMEELRAKGIEPGPQSFGSWNDGDAALIRAVWCVTRHLQPEKVVETGVAHGVTSRFILEALERNKQGKLSSIDLPLFEKSWQKQIGIAVGDGYAKRWAYIKGSSRLQLPKLLAQLGQIDLFIHDSLHSERNVRFELDRVWASLRPGGIMIVDDVDANWGFHSFTHSFSGHTSLICEAEPIRPDLRRFNKKGMFGIIQKDRVAAEKAA
jgi:hypothetical protein